MQLFQNGERKAFDHLYNRYSKRLFGYFMKMLWNDREHSEDSLHDLFLKIIHRPELYNPQYEFKAWIFKSAYNLCKNKYRRMAYFKAMQNEMGNEAEGKHSNIESKIDEDIQMDFLHQNLEQIDEELRSMFLMRYQEEMSIEELALIYDIPEGTVKSRLFTIRKNLTEKMKIKDGT